MRIFEDRVIPTLMKSVLFSVLSKSYPQPYNKVHNGLGFLRNLTGGLQC